jgi:HD-GYP domain-containing protein (c-di-GMP phosphodiesterase class II)
MNLVTVNIDSIRIGQPLPFSLRDEGGVLLAQKGYVVTSRGDLELMIGRRSNLFIDVAESDSHRRAYMGKLNNLVMEEKSLGQIAGAQMSSADVEVRRDTGGDGEPDWLDLQTQANAMLRDSNPASFINRLQRLQAQLSRHSQLNPDGTLFALIHLSSSDVQMYSATHSMLVAVMCSLAAREVLKWPAEQETLLCNAALTMNISMTDLQDRMARQKEAPSPEQRRQLADHSIRSVQILQQLGVDDSVWLEAVLDHHTKMPGPLAGRTPGQRIARLIQRADMFAARMAPRVARQPESPAAAMQACYFDENRQIDETGAALIKAVGIYSPGSFVRLTTNEIAVVIKRGSNTTTPRVALLINRNGMPTGELIVRDTSQADYRIVASVPHRDVKVQLNLERLLVLTKAPVSDRLW